MTGFGISVKKSYSRLLSDRFIAPPFNVFNARQGYWIRRKRKWFSLGIKSWKGDKRGIILKPGNGNHEQYERSSSVFDPVLCEIAYKWFCPAGGQILDPFAGGSVRGIVAHVLGYKYWGCDLREEQVTANNVQANKIIPDNQPSWVVGDSLTEIQNAPKADFIFTCPPYSNLEKYSDSPNDLSNMSESKFISALGEIIKKSCDKLKDNRFAGIVVGNYRVNDELINMSGYVEKMFKKYGLILYNKAVLITITGNSGMRAAYFFPKKLKLMNNYQDVLFFFKGDTGKIKEMAEGIKKRCSVLAKVG